MATTFGEALSKIGVTIPDHLIADAEVPVIIDDPQAQGDLIVVAAEDDSFDTSHVTLEPLTHKGVQAVVGEATGNTHWLHPGLGCTGVRWGRVINHELVVGVVDVPEGETAELIHTDEHGCNAMGPGMYVIRGKRELADEIRRVAD